MPSAQRRINPGVAQQLLAEPYRFDFFQAVRVLEQWFIREGERPQDILPYKLYFRNTLNMSFPASDIEQLNVYDAHHEKLDAANDKPEKVDITPAFMGMLGVQGVLPTTYTEQLGRRETYHRDHAARAFFDVFTNRAVALFYDAWKKYRLSMQYELHGEKRYLPLVSAIAGFGMPHHAHCMAEGEGVIHDQALAHFAGSLTHRPLSAATLKRLLSEYFNVELSVEQFVGAWYEVPEEQRTRLGHPMARLGQSALAGKRVWQRDLRMRLWIGPLRSDRFRDFLPGGSAAKALAKWLKLLTGNALEYQVQLTLHRDDIKPSQLGRRGDAQLGWNSFLCTRSSKTHRSSTSYLVHTLH